MTRRTLPPWASAASLFAVVLAVFWPCLDGGWVRWDDPRFLLDNPHYRGFAWANLRWMFTTALEGPYEPLAWLTYAADFRLWGLEPGGYHLTSVVLHGAGAVALFFTCRELFSRAAPQAGETSVDAAAALAALLYALHPLRVEPVAWASDRRDVLVVPFYLLSMLAWLRGRRGLSLAAFALALLSKASAVTLPVALLVLDVYPLRRGPRLAEKAPYFALAALFTAVGFAAQRSVDAVRSLGDIGPAGRAALVFYSLSFYVRKTLLPLGLSPFYQLRLPLRLTPDLAAGLAATAALAAAAWRARARWPAAAAAAVAYAAAVAPTSGVIPLGSAAVADRYGTIPGLVLAAGGAGLWLAHRRRAAASALAAAALLMLAAAARAQLGAWRSTESLWRAAVERDPDGLTARLNLGVELAEQGRLGEALAQLAEACRRHPADSEARENLGQALAQAGRWREAEAEFRESMRLAPARARPPAQLGLALARQGRAAEALEAYRRALRLDPSLVEARHNLAGALAGLGKAREAIGEFQRALEAAPGRIDTRANLGLLLAASGDGKGSAEVLREAARRAPSAAAPRFLWGNLLAGQGRLREAERLYRDALRLEQGHKDARFNLANTLARQGRYAEAQAQYEELSRRDPGAPEPRRLAALVRRLRGGR